MIAKTLPHTSITSHTPSVTATPLGNSASSAKSLLRDVHTESEAERGSKKSVFARNKSLRGTTKEPGQSRHYAKMGLLMESPTKHPPAARGASGVSSSRGVVNEDVVGGDYEVVTLEGEEVQASPPISVQSGECLETGHRADVSTGVGEGHTSSPDSGYGNTPDNPGGEAPLIRHNHLTRDIGGTQQEPVPMDKTGLRTSLSVPSSLASSHDSILNRHSSSSMYAEDQDSGLVSLSLAGNSRELEQQLHERTQNHVHPPHPPPGSASPSAKRRRGRTTSGRRFTKSSGMGGAGTCERREGQNVLT